MDELQQAITSISQTIRRQCDTPTSVGNVTHWVLEGPDDGVNDQLELWSRNLKEGCAKQEGKKLTFDQFRLIQAQGMRRLLWLGHRECSNTGADACTRTAMCSYNQLT